MIRTARPARPIPAPPRWVYDDASATPASEDDARRADASARRDGLRYGGRVTVSVPDPRVAVRMRAVL